MDNNAPTKDIQRATRSPTLQENAPGRLNERASQNPRDALQQTSAQSLSALLMDTSQASNSLSSIFTLEHGDPQGSSSNHRHFDGAHSIPALPYSRSPQASAETAMGLILARELAFRDEAFVSQPFTPRYMGTYVDDYDFTVRIIDDAIKVIQDSPPIPSRGVGGVSSHRKRTNTFQDQ